ncbi:MAG: histidinol-phosphate transaminase [candidate division FCPU426 bacterium]
MRPLKRFSALQPYQPGKPIEEVKRELGLSSVIKMASNENPLGPSPKAAAAARKAIAGVHRYPEGSAHALRQALSKTWGLDGGHFILGDGSNEVLIFAAQAFVSEGDAIAFSDRSFAVYELASHLCGARIRKVASPEFVHDLDALARAAKGAKVVYVCNPNNPTGSHHPPAAIQRFLNAVPKETLVVLDEAYAEYAGHSMAQDKLWLKKYPNLLICRTFSKLYGLAGLRVGYGVASAAVIQNLEKCRQPFNLNSVGQKAAAAALSDHAFARKTLALNRQGLTKISSFFKKEGIWFIPSKTNFIFFREPKPGTYQALLKQGVIIRPFGDGHLRVTTGTLAENDRFIRTLKRILA